MLSLPKDAQLAAGSVAQATAELEEPARREAYPPQLLAEKQDELKKLKESLKKESGGKPHPCWQAARASSRA